MSAATCPNREELFDYAVGRLSDETSDSVAEHLESCESCQAGLATFDDADDTLVARLQQPADDDPYAGESQCKVAVARARAVAGRPVPEGGRSADPASTHSLLLGVLGEYQLLEKLGRGGMGTVYRAMHTKLDRVVALKVLPKSRSDDDQAIARFEREMKAIGRLDHPNIVGAYDAREIEGKPVLIMEYVEGLDLAKLVRRCGALSVGDACELARQAALGLQYAHENGLVHRDVKPSNLMLTPQGELKVLDLGLARFHREQAGGEEMTGSGQAMGTADYMAPEQASDSRTVDIRADVYSLGCTLYKLLSGRAPFGGPDYRGTFEKMTAHVQEPVPPIGESDADVPDELAAVLDRMLAKEPDERFATPEEVAEALKPFCIECDLAGLVVRAAEAEPAAAEGEPPCPAPPRDGSSAAPQSQPTPLPFWRRGKLVAAALGLMLLSAGAGIALGIIITIYRDGKATRIGVEDGSTVNVDRHGNVGVTPPGKTGKAGTPAAAKSDFEAIQGTWQVESSSFKLFHFPCGGTYDHGRVTREDIVASTSVVITKDAFKILGRDVVDATYECQLNPTTQPKMFELKGSVPEGHSILLGIYGLEGDRLTLCMAKDERPRQLWAELGSNKELLVLRRTGPAKLDPDETAIQGRWRIVRGSGGIRIASRSGSGWMIPIPEGAIFEDKTVVISRHRMTFQSREKRVRGRPPNQLGGVPPLGYALDPSQVPNTIDLLNGSVPCLGIYKLEDDQLTIQAGQYRPKDFTANPGENEVLMVLKRDRDGTAAPDAEAIQGTWRAVGAASKLFRKAGVSESGTEFGTPIPPQEQAKQEKVVITEDRFTFAAGTSKPEEYEYRLGPTNTPKTLDFLSSGKRAMAGIYELEGDQLKILISGIEVEGEWVVLADQRPAGFPSEPGTDHILLVLERDKITPLERLDVHVDKDGRASIDGKIYDRGSLQTKLQEILKGSPQMRVRLSAASQTQHRHVVAILDLVKAAGVTDVSIVVGEPLAAARLDFRIVPTRDGTGGPAVDEAEIRRYIDELKRHGPEPNEQRLKIALQEELGVIIGQMNGVETASVLYDTQITGGLRREKITLASVSVKPSGSQRLDDSQARAIRRLVAGAVAGLKPEDVTVADLSGCIYHGDTDGTDAPEGPYAAEKPAYERKWKAKILDALAYVPGVSVAVNVTFDRETVPQSEKPGADSQQKTGLAPTRVRVWVSIPGSYIEKVWQERDPPATGKQRNTPSQAALDAIRKEQTTKIRQQIASLLPAADGVDDLTELVTVTFSGGKRREAYAWFELPDEFVPHAGSITATYRGRSYVLLAATPGDVMLAEEDGKRAWGLEAVHLERDPQGHPAIGMDLDEQAQRRFAALTGSHLNQRLAMLLNDRVVCTPTIKTKLSRRALITGRFDAEEIQQMLRALQAGMVLTDRTAAPAAEGPRTFPPQGEDRTRKKPAANPDGAAVQR